MTTPDLPSEIDSRELVSCPNCKAIYRIPRTETVLKITCSHCQTVFYKNLPARKNRRRIKYLLPAAVIVLITMIILLVQFAAKQTPSPNNSAISKIDEESKPGKPKITGPASSNWITISYGGLVDGSIITHSGETVSEVVRKIPDYDETLKGLVQQYLEPYSFLCHDVLLSISDIDSFPLVNITYYYPIGVPQPAWASLFREGHFQLYYNPHLIRLFLKGTNPQQSFDKYRSVVRHPIQDVLERHPSSIKQLEVYVFSNDYSRMEMRLNTVPAIYPIDAFDLSPTNKQIDLASIEDFLKEGVILEAVEVDGDNDLYFYGRKAPRQTIAGFPISLSDIAVIYRSVFHYGNNAPYISLDKHEDNRFAKVNFGGHLENTRVGQVVLEADKLFKTIGTGLDPNTHENVKSRIAKYVSGFLTEDERSLLEDHTPGHSLIRYWFYPDSIGTVTDGSIGVVMTHQFLADVERMDVKVSVSSATRRTIDHLNHHFSEYENADVTYKELSTVGRIMALVNWLKGMNMNQRIELDEFLSVPLPALTTPLHTKKLLAVSAIAYPKYSPPDVGDVRAYTRVFYLSQLLDRHGPATKDERFMENASRSVPDISGLAFPRQKQLKSTVDVYEPLIKENESRILSLERDIERRKYTLDRTSQYEVDSYNALVERSNGLIQTQKSYINIYNEAVQELNEMQVQTRQITSIGGGINLSPKEFKVMSRDITSPRIRELNAIRNSIRTVGNVARSGDWVRNNVAGRSLRVNLIPRGEWTSSKRMNGKTKYSYRSSSAEAVSMSLFAEQNQWESNISVNNSHHVVRFSKTTNVLQVNNSPLKSELVGKLSTDRRRIVFSK
ncbi:MAG: hypothetical protein Q8K98_04615 [Bacteroidota bacterium]|nr:hypothetical protein [Bacteroidota bacterium]